MRADDDSLRIQFVQIASNSGRTHGELLAEPLHGRLPITGDQLDSVFYFSQHYQVFRDIFMYAHDEAAQKGTDQIATLWGNRKKNYRNEPQPDGTPVWQSLPSWFVFGSGDKNIPVEGHRFMADRAASRKTVEVDGASHSVMVSHPDEVADLILEALESFR